MRLVIVFCEQVSITVYLIIIGEEYKECAAKVHKSCWEEFSAGQVENHHAFQNLMSWAECYKPKIKEDHCPAPLLLAYVKQLESVDETLFSELHAAGGLPATN